MNFLHKSDLLCHLNIGKRIFLNPVLQPSNTLCLEAADCTYLFSSEHVIVVFPLLITTLCHIYFLFLSVLYYKSKAFIGCSH